MSKFFKISIALLVCAAVATPALAIQADFKGMLQVRGFLSDNLNGNDDVKDARKFTDQRFRLSTDVALNENVKAIFATEIDYVWGADNSADGGVGRVGADTKAQIEIMHLYLDFNIPDFNTNVKAGTQYMSLGRGFILAENVAGLAARYTPVKGQSYALFWVKMREGDAVHDNQDADYLQLQYDGTFGGVTVSPYVGYLKGAPTGNNLPAFTRDFEAWYLGVDLNGKAGPFGYAATAVVNMWDNNLPGAAQLDNTAFALWAKGTYNLGATLLSAEAAWYGDDEIGTFVNVRSFNNFSEIVTGGRLDNRNPITVPNPAATPPVAGFRYNGSQTVTNTGHSAFYNNWMYVKLGAEQKISDRQKLSAYYIYSQEAEDLAGRTAAFGGPAKKTMGHEINAYYDISVVKGLTFSVIGAYLLADNDFGAGDDAWKAGTVLSYQF